MEANRLSDDIEDVRASTRLTNSPVCLVAPDSGIDMHMERVLKVHQKYQGETKPVLEINTNHTLIKKLADLAEKGAANDDMKEAGFLLLDQARIIQGQPLNDPAAFARRMASFMERGLA